MQHFGSAKILEVYAYYQGEKFVTDADRGTVLRFIESTPLSTKQEGTGCKLPGLLPVHATFDGAFLPCYCDHWVSNVVSRTGFLDVLEDTLVFVPKVDFNAGVVAAGEAQIESTVTGNTSTVQLNNAADVLRDQSQVYLPINNALSPVGHVHGFLHEIGQGIQHIASRVGNLAAFVQRANDYRKITGEGFTFLHIPRSYYGVLTAKMLECGIAERCDSVQHLLTLDCAFAVMKACEDSNIIKHEGAVDLHLSEYDIAHRLSTTIAKEHKDEYLEKQDEVVKVVLHSRYSNLYRLLRHHLTEKSYIDIVRNQILVDVQVRV